MNNTFSDRLKNIVTNKENYLSILGGIIFVLVFHWGYQGIDPNWYEYRDDGVITMSTAKNLVDFGFIGVNPSGPIVEASSSPMQFFTYAFFYWITSVGYDTYSYFQTVIATFLIGFLFIRFFVDKPSIAITLTTISAFGLTYFYPFFEWHASGMENAITHVLFIATVYILYSFFRNETINYWLAIIVFFATIARLDSVYHIAPLLLIFSIFWFFQYKNYKAFYFSLIVFFLWIVFHSWRYYYFGDFLPNTAYAQNISIGDRIHLLLNGDLSYLQQSFVWSKEIFLKQAGWLLIVTLPLWLLFKPSKNGIFLFLLIFSIIFTSTFNPFLFGPTRIEIPRSTTQMAIMIFLFFSLLVYTSKSTKSSLITLMLISPITIFSYHYQDMKPYYLGWSTKDFNEVRDRFIIIAKENNIARPTISNPDLGVMTWYKELNDVDLGMLGTPAMAKLKNGPLITEYYLNYALPDIIEAHDYWVDMYCDSIFAQDKFDKLYSPLDKSINMKEVCSSKDKIQNFGFSFWVRNDIIKGSHSRERLFLDKLQQDLNIERIQNEIKECNDKEQDCSYIARTVYKFIPELRMTKKIDEVIGLFSSDVDKALLSGWHDGKANDTIINHIQDQVFKKSDTQPKINANYNLYIEDNKIIYVKEKCSKKDTSHQFYLHIVPVDQNDLLSGEDGFKNMDFHFDGLIKNNQCIVSKQLPQFPIKRIDTGQYSVINDENGKITIHWAAQVNVK